MLASTHQALALHCGPVLLGQKPAALISLPHGHLGEAEHILAALSNGPRWQVLRRGAGMALFLVYQETLLRAALEAAVPQASLKRLGYPVDSGPEAMIARLAVRMCGREDFPHEVGFFLGYPQRDVLGFMRHRGKCCKYSGQWKVYGDVALAKALFARYAQCSAYLLARVRQDGSVLSALGATGCANN